MIARKKIFITGGLGFIGTALCRRLCRNNRITIFDNAKRNSFQYFDLKGNKNIRVIKGDVRNARLLKASLNYHDYIVHCAAIAGVSSYYRIPFETMEVNILGTYNLLQAAKGSQIERFIDFSTSEVYGIHAKNVKETDPTSQGRIDDPRWTYGISKLASEKLSYCFKWEFDLPIVTIRPFNIYGPGQVGEGAIQIFIHRALENQDIQITGDGAQVRAWCYIDDLIGGLIACMEKKEAIGETFNIGNPKASISTYALAKKIIRLTRSKSKCRFVPHIGTDIAVRIPDITKAQKMLEYSPCVDLAKGLSSTIKWIKQIP